MEIKILQVFYGKDGLPYKDKDRQVHFPIVGTGFLGASKTTKIKFYYDELDNLDETTWVAVSKLPNGKLGSRVLETYLDEELNEHYALLELDNYYTQYKGDVFISLQGYQGGVDFDYDEENSQYEIHGTPTIAATRSIKFTINYANQFVGSGETDNINFQRILAALGTKLGMRAYSEHVEELPSEGSPDIFYVVNDEPNNPNLANIYIWNAISEHYVWVGDNTLDLGNYYTQEQGDQFEEEIGNRVSSVESELSSVASGSPKGVYATLSDLETAYPTGTTGIYVVSANGHWYYWNGSAWTDGGIYLSAPNVVYNDGNILRDYLGNNIYPDLFKRLNFINPSANITGGYYGDDGSVVSAAGSSYNTEYIEVEGGKTLVWSSRVNIQILTYDEDKTFIERIATQTEQYATLGSTVKYIRVSIYSGNFSNFMFTYLELYQTFVSYKGYVNGKNVIDNSLLSKAFKYGELESVVGTPVELTYLDKTNYEYVDVGDGYLNDYGQFVSNSSYHTIYFVVKEDEITLWYNSVTGGTYLSICITNGNFGNRYSQVGVRYRLSYGNMPTQANPLTLKRGQIVGITYGTDVSNFSLGVSGVIGYYNVKEKFKFSVSKAISVLKSGDNYSINMNGYTFDFLKLNIPAKNLNSYDIYQVSKNGTIIEDGQLFCAVKEVGESDFMGGRDHGDDIMISMNILADGVPVTENVSCNKLDIYLETYLQNVTDKHNVFKKYIHIIFENNTMKTDVNLVCLVNNFSLDVACTGMWGQRKPFIDKILFNCVDYDISTSPTTLLNSNIESSSYILSNPDGLVNIVNKENIKARIVHFNTENDQRVKTYFVMDESKTLNENDCLKSSSIYYLN